MITPVPDLAPLTPGAHRVLDAASELFYARGIHVVGVDAIAAAAGHDLAGEPTLPEWLHEWRRSVALPSARTPLPHTWDLDTVRRG